MHQSLFVSFYNKNLPNNKVYQNVLAEVHMIMEIFLGPPESINQSINKASGPERRYKFLD